MHGDTKSKSRIFICYARPDVESAITIYRELREAGFKPWIDVVDSTPGDRREVSITKAIRNSSLFLLCLSGNAVTQHGLLQKEIASALKTWEDGLTANRHLIRVRLAACQVPARLSKFREIDIFRKDGWQRLLEAIHQESAHHRGTINAPIVSKSPAPEYTTVPAIDKLTFRERQILACYLDDSTYSQIGKELGISENTVKNHMTRIYEKLDIVGAPNRLRGLFNRKA
jgi:ATP/maltotriose-dependent transcriptional regulator MalT